MSIPADSRWEHEHVLDAVQQRLDANPQAMRQCALAAQCQTGETMPAFICSACGTQYPPSDAPPVQCPVCEKSVSISTEGQSWTTLERLRISHHNGSAIRPGSWNWHAAQVSRSANALCSFAHRGISCGLHLADR
jgi:hypothetical protein